MKSARRNKFRAKRIAAHKGGVKSRNIGLILRIVIPATVILGVVALVNMSTRFWNGHDKVGFVTSKPNGDVLVTILDPKLTEMTLLTIPGDTEVDVAENYGTLRIKNVWQLSHNEKLRGRLLPETITQNFLFPTVLWSQVGVDNIWQFIFNPGDTNIPFGDRISIELFALKVPSLGTTEINLGDNQFLKKVKLNDGTAGYQLNGTPSERLTIYFADNDLSQGNLRVDIVDASGAYGVSDKIGQIIQVLGGKVVSIDKKATENSDCLILGANKSIVKKISTLFSCQIGKGSTDFDLEIKIGANFAKRF